MNGDGQISLEEMQVWLGIHKDGMAKDRSPTDIQLTEYNPPNAASVQSFLWLREAPSPRPEEAASRLLDIATVIPHHMGDQRSEPAPAIELSEFEAEAKKRSLDIPFEVTKVRFSSSFLSRLPRGIHTGRERQREREGKGEESIFFSCSH